MITLDDVDWLTAGEVHDQIGADISTAMLWDWKRRGLIRGTVIRRVAHYRRDDVETAEASTRTSKRGRSRSRRAS